MHMGTKRYELTDGEWNRIKDMLPPEHPKEGKRGRPTKCDNRTAVNGMLWIANAGAPWRELPERYGPWQTGYSRFRKWRDTGVYAAVFQALSVDADLENIAIDSTSCKVHQSANGGEKTENKAVGVSRGGRNTKIHALVDGFRLLFCSVPAMIMIPSTRSPCSVKSILREAIFLRMAQKRSATILIRRKHPIRSHLRAMFPIRGRLIGTPTKNGI